MKKHLLIFFFALTATLNSAAQTPTPTPDGDVVRISTNLIRLDVSVLDSKGKAVSDLRPEEIELYENGQKQKITSLRFVSVASTKPEQPKSNDKIPVPVPTGQLRPEQIRRTIALIVDDLTLSFESAYHTRRALKKFVDEQMEEGDLVAILRSGAGIGALQQFTADKRILYAAIEKVRWNPAGNGGISAFAPIRPSLVPSEEEEEEPEPGTRTAEGIEREFNDFRESYFATGTLGAIDYVVRGMSELPGRKSILLFSDGFRLTNTSASGAIENSRIIDPIRRLIEQANRASVVIYAMDPRGLVYTGLTAQDDTGGRSAASVESELSQRRDQISDTQQSLRFISEETGGFALVNNNDLSGGVKRVLEDQSYYLISYEPDDETFDPVKRRFNKIDIKVLRSGAKARYRSGFFNVADREQPPATSVAANPLTYALVSPVAANGVNVRLNALFGNDAKNVSYVRSLLHINASDLEFADSENGEKKVTFEVLAMSFGDNGAIVDQLGKSYTLSVKPEAFRKMSTEGFVYHFLFPVKKAGPYQFRVAIRDTKSGKIGSASQFVDVPDLKKKRLTLSSLVIENLSEAEWKNASSGTVAYQSNPMTDTALRRVKPGTVLRFGFEVYNARQGKEALPNLTTQTRLYRDGKVIMEGAVTPLDLLGQTDMQHIKVARALAVGDKFPPGDYILQIIVTDAADPKKPKIATQFIEFEVVA